MRYNYIIKNSFGERAELNTPGIAWKVFGILRKYSKSCQVIRVNVDNPMCVNCYRFISQLFDDVIDEYVLRKE